MGTFDTAEPQGPDTVGTVDEQLRSASGEWTHLASTTLGYWLPRNITGAKVTVTTGNGEVRFRADTLWRDRKWKHVEGRGDGKPDADGAYAWKSRGLNPVAGLFRMSVQLSPCRELLGIAHPGTMLTNPGLLLFMRSSLSIAEGRRILERCYGTFGLSSNALLMLRYSEAWADLVDRVPPPAEIPVSRAFFED